MIFFKFPRTPHIFVLPGINIRNDKVLASKEADDFFHNIISVEEKVDGANVGFSIDENDTLKIQNRGNYLSIGEHPQFGPIWNWGYERINLFVKHLEKRYILFGEWCFAQHSIHYSALPQWLLGFDIYDKTQKRFLARSARDLIFKKLDVIAVPLIGEKTFSKNDLIRIVEQRYSQLGGKLEGIYLRLESDSQLLKRAKLVRQDFIQDIDNHWSNRILKTNDLL